MDHTRLPACSCGSKTWEGGGASLSSVFAQTHHRCTRCGARGMMLAHSGGNVFIQGEIEPSVMSYINTTLMTTWRADAKRLETTRAEFMTQELKVINRDLGLPEGTRGSTVPDDRSAEWRAAFNAVYDRSFYQMPPGFERVPVPPKFPLEHQGQVFIKHRKPDDDWVLVDPRDTQDLVVLPDPIRVTHDEYFGEIFAALEARFGEIERVEVANEYYKDSTNAEPWYRFYLKGLRFKLGPRKRVNNIEASADEPCDLTAIRDQASADDTTYYVDGDWKSDVARHRNVCVHAWTKEKTVSYIELIVKGR